MYLRAPQCPAAVLLEWKCIILGLPPAIPTPLRLTSLNLAATSSCPLPAQQPSFAPPLVVFNPAVPVKRAVVLEPRSDTWEHSTHTGPPSPATWLRPALQGTDDGNLTGVLTSGSTNTYMSGLQEILWDCQNLSGLVTEWASYSPSQHRAFARASKILDRRN